MSLEWYPASKLAGLPNLADTRQGIHWASAQQNWQRRPREGRGGGFEFHVSSLPPEAVAELFRREAISATKTGQVLGQLYRDQSRAEKIRRNMEHLAEYVKLKPADKDRVHAREDVLKALDAFRAMHGMTIRDARAAFCEEFNCGLICTEDDIRAEVKSLSTATLSRWAGLQSKDGPAGLADRFGNRRGLTIIDQDEDIRNLVIALITQNHHCSSAHVVAGIRARFKKRRRPSYRTVQRWIAKWKKDNASLYLSITNPDAWKSKYQAAAGSRSEGIVRLNQLWEMDSSPTDIMLKDGRHTLIGVIDIYSRRLKILVSKTSVAIAVSGLIRQAIIDWGIPEIIKTDNGADYVSKHIERVMAVLNITQKLCPPFTPEAKPHIERAFKTFSHGLMELLPGYIGHNVADRKAIESRKKFSERLGSDGIAAEMTAEEFQKFCDEWCQHIYSHNSHGGLDGKTPFQKASEWRGNVTMIQDMRPLDLLISPAPDDGGIRTVIKSGIRYDGALFSHPVLGKHVGEQVRLLLDTSDIGKVFVLDDIYNYICTAICHERTGISREDVAQKKTARQRAHLSEQKAATRAAAKAANTDGIVRDIILDRAAETSRLIPFPSPQEPHGTPALTAALTHFAEPHQPSEEQSKAHIAAVKKMMAEVPATPIRSDFDRALDLMDRMEAGQDVADGDRKWLRVYQTSAAYKANKAMHEDYPGYFKRKGSDNG